MGQPLRFGVFEFDPESRELRKRGTRLHLPEQSLEILALLVERPQQVVTREEIRERLWPHGTVVEFEHSVNSAVRRLRDCLGDSATTPRFIETLPKRGYRFIAPVEAGHPSHASPHFRILGELGRGGMGIVYKAEDLVLGRTVALKFLPDALAGHAPSIERFSREARTLASLNHPGICALHGIEAHEGRVCLVMEYLEGRPLSRSDRDRAPRVETGAGDWCVRLCRARGSAFSRDRASRHHAVEHLRHPGGAGQDSRLWPGGDDATRGGQG